MLMRFVLLTLLVGALVVSAGAVTIVVPDEDLGIVDIQQAVFMAEAGDTVLVMSGVYDSVRSFETPLGRREAVVSITSDIVLLGEDRGAVRINYEEAEYGIICQNVGPDALISNLTVLGGGLSGRRDDGGGDDRILAAGICCVDAASPTIRDVDIENGATGIVVRTGPGSADSAPLLEGVVVARGSHHGLYVYENGSTPIVVDRCTFVDNFDYGIYVSGGTVEISNTAVTHNGKPGIYGYLATPVVRYCNVYWNDQMFPDPGTGPVNYGGTLDDLTGVDGNISAEPYYCDFFGSAGYDYHVCPTSPNDGAGEGGVTIGAFDAVVCDCVSPVEATTWGAIKALYRR
jgi:hypothetical protein